MKVVILAGGLSEKTHHHFGDIRNSGEYPFLRVSSNRSFK